MKKIEIPGPGDELQSEWFVFYKDGTIELWGENLGRAGRYTARKLRGVSHASMEARLKASQEKIEAAADEAAKTAAKKQTRQEWIDTLAGKSFHGCIINSRGEVEDHVGNYLFSLPREPNGANVGAWIKNEMDEYMEGAE